MGAHKAESIILPTMLRPLFWDCNFEQIDWEDGRDFIISRVLTCGEWEAIQWLREKTGDTCLREWLELHNGGGLSPERLRFWELILHIPHHTANTWIAESSHSLWTRRVAQ